MIKMGVYIEPFDFRTIFFDYFLGNSILAAFALIILVSFAAANYRMSNRLYLILLLLSTVLFAAYVGEAIYAVVLFVTGFIVFKLISRIVT